jgi:hypothetical protein
MNFQALIFSFIKRKLILISLVIILAFLFFESSFAQQQNDYRTTGSGNWTDPIWQRYDTATHFWSGSTTLGGTVNALTISGGTTVSLNTGVNVSQFTVNGTLTLDAGQSLVLANGAGTDLTVNGTISGAGDIVLPSGTSANLVQGTLSGTGVVNVSAGASFTVSGSCNLNRVLNNNGSFIWASGAINGTGTINNNTVFSNQTSFGSSSSVVMNNSGTMTKTTNNQNIFFGSFTNSGTININSGNITFGQQNGSSTIGGIIGVASGATLQFGQTSFVTFTVNASISGAGTVMCYTTAVNFSTSCIYNISGVTSAWSGTMTFTAGMTLTNIGNISPAGGTILLPAGLNVGAYGSILTLTAGGTFTANTGRAFNFQKISLVGYITGSDTITASDSITISSATLSGTGPLVLNSGGYCTIFNNGMTMDKNFINNGSISWTASSFFGSGTFYNNGTFTMSANAGSTYPGVINAGTFIKSSSNISQIVNSFTNTSSGTLNIMVGTMLINVPSGTSNIAGNVNVSSGAILQFGNASGSTFNVSGNIIGAGSFYGHTTNINFLSGSTYNITGTTGCYSGNTTFNSGMNLTSLGNLTCGGGTINFQPGVTVGALNADLAITAAGTINFNSGQKFQFANVTLNGTIAGSDTVNCSGTMTYSGATLSGSGPLNMLNGSQIHITNNTVTLSKTVNNYGTINWTFSNIVGNGIINNYNIFTIATTNASYSTNPLVNNFGTINKTTSTTTPMAGGCVNSGTINITSGTLQIMPTTTTQTHSGTFNVSSGATLNIGSLSGIVTHNVNGSVSGAGSVIFNAANVNFGPSSSYNISGTTNGTSGTVTFNSTMTLTNLGTLTSTGGTMNFQSGLVIGAVSSNITISFNGTINFNTGISRTFNQIDLSGNIGGTDSVFVNSALNWTSGIISNTTILKWGGTAAVNNSTVTLNGKFINNGTFSWTQLQISGAGTFVNNNILNFAPVANYTFSPNLINNGTLNKNTTAFIPTVAGLFTNNGTVNINTGGIALLTSTNYSPAVINIANGTTFAVNNGTFTTTGTMNIASGSTINGNGIISYNAPVLVNNANISVATFQFDSVTTLSGSGSINMTNCYFLNGCNVTLTSSHQFKNITVYAGGTFNLNGYKTYFNGTGTTIINNGTFTIGTSTIEYNGASQQTISTQNITYRNLNVNNSSGVQLVGTLNVTDTLSILFGFLNINQNNIILSSTGYLNEVNGTVRGVNGTISTTRTLDSLEGVNVAGLGATITTKKVLGLTTISRGHNPYTINGSSAVQRFYNISPANNTGLNATLVYHYDNSELNGLNKSFLALYRSTNAGTNWTIQGGSKDTANNTVTFTNINAFSYWIAANNPLAASVNITAIVDAFYNTSTNTLNKRDTMTVYLRNSTSPYAIIDSAKIIPDTITFSAIAYFNVTPTGTYYITVKSKSTLEFWSKAGGQAYTAGTSMSFDFTSAQSQSYNNSTILKNGKYCLISGDINQDGFVNGNDFTLFSQQFGQTGYLRSDLNGDNVVNGNDFTSFSASFGKQSIHP